MNGNVTATGGKSFTYNSQNQLISMNSGAVQIVYDGEGNRVSKTVGGTDGRYRRSLECKGPAVKVRALPGLPPRRVRPGEPAWVAWVRADETRTTRTRS
jgi:YD repeat-containing protein